MSEFTEKADAFLERQEVEHPQNLIAAAELVDINGLHPGIPGPLACDAVPNTEAGRVRDEFDRIVRDEHDDAAAKVDFGNQARDERKVGKRMVLRPDEEAKLKKWNRTIGTVAAVTVIGLAVADGYTISPYMPMAFSVGNSARYWFTSILVAATVFCAGIVAYSRDRAFERADNRHAWKALAGLVAVPAAAAIAVRVKASNVEAQASGIPQDPNSLALFAGLQVVLSGLSLLAALAPVYINHRRYEVNRAKFVAAADEQGVVSQQFLGDEPAIRAKQHESLDRIELAGFAAFRLQLERRMGMVSPSQLATMKARNRNDFMALGLLRPNGPELPDGGVPRIGNPPLGTLEAPAGHRADDDGDITVPRGAADDVQVDGDGHPADGTATPVAGPVSPQPDPSPAGPTGGGRGTVFSDFLNPNPRN